MKTLMRTTLWTTCLLLCAGNAEARQASPATTPATAPVSAPIAQPATEPTIASAGSASTAPASTAPTTTQAAIAVNISVDVSKTQGEIKPIWRFFGYDEPNYTYLPDGQKLLTQIADLGAPTKYVRAHSLLVTGDGLPALKWGSTNAYTEDAAGNPVYDWTIVDKIIDTYRERGMRPYMQIGFMPEAMSTKPDPYRHHWKPGDNYNSIYTGWAYPPKDYDKWRELVYQWVKHSVDKYGKEEVERWYWQVWNEPNIGYWKGTPEEFYKLYDYAIDGVLKALPTAHVGGPEVAGGGNPWMRNFFKHVISGKNYATGKTGTQIDFISFHAKGQPKFTSGHVVMGVNYQLRDIDRAFGIVNEFPELKGKPIIIGESDPDGCAACSAEVYPQNAYRNTTLYPAYTAASFMRKYALAEKHGVNLEGAVTWAFEFEGEPYFAGFRALATRGIELPVFNAFRMMAHLSGQRISAESDAEIPLEAMLKDGVRGDRPDVAAMASLDAKKLSVMVWNYHDVDLPGADANIKLAFANLPAGASRMELKHYRIDQTHSNAYTAWLAMGSPKDPTPEQYAHLEQAAKLQLLENQRTVLAEDGKLTLDVTLPRQGLSLLVFSWE